MRTTSAADFKDLLRQSLSGVAASGVEMPTVPALHAAVAVIFRNSAQGTFELLMIRRALDPRDRWGGQMAFPGGKHEPPDADLQETVTRETLEEIGLDLAEEADFLGHLPPVPARHRGRKIPLTIHPFVYWLEKKFREKIDATEVDSLHWIRLEHFFARANHGDYELKTDDVALNLPCISYPPVPIWGLSYLILKDLFDLILESASAGAMRRYVAGDYFEAWRPYPTRV